MAVPASVLPGSSYAVDHDVFVVHADDDTPFIKGELLPMLGLPDDRVILSSELPFPAFTEQAIEDAVQRSRLTLAVLSPAYLRDRWAGFAELLSRNVRADGRGGSLVPLWARLDQLQMSSDDGVTMAAFAWAVARLTRGPEGVQRTRLLHAYQKLANNAHLYWIWNGTKYALTYGHFRFDHVKPILDVLELLAKPVTDETRSQLAELLQPQNTRGSRTK